MGTNTHSIKINDLLYQEVQNVPIFGKNDFSEKVEYILQKYINKKAKKNEIPLRLVGSEMCIRDRLLT